MNIGDDYKNIQEANKKYLVQDNDVMKKIFIRPIKIRTDLGSVFIEIRRFSCLHKYGCTVLQHRRENV